ncbi:MAG: nucleoside hydrolase [Acidimicrobiales bacterium]
MRIWLDTDIGTDVDDALALAYVLRHPGLELVGVSTVFGDMPLRVEIVEALLALADVDPLPVLPGMGVPLTDRRHGIMFGHEGRGLVDHPDPTLRVREEQGADDRIAVLADALADTGPDMVLAIGPMTNLGALAASGVALPPLTVMGGKFEEVMLPGMVADVVEWNWHCDPLAVQHVLAAQHPLDVTIVPAEVTFRTGLEAADIDRLSQGDTLQRALAVLCRHWLTTQAEQFAIEHPVIALHDPLTAAILVEPDLCTYRPRRIEVDDRGATTEVEGAPNIRAATGVDAEATRRLIMDTLTGGAGGR